MNATITVNGVKAPSIAQFINHLLKGGHVIYASLLLLNDLETSQLHSGQKDTVFHYLIKSDSEVIIKRSKFGNLVPINFRLEFIELVPLSCL